MNLSFKSIAKSSLMIIGACVVFGEVKSCVNNPDKYYFKTKKKVQEVGKFIDKQLSQAKPTCDFNLAAANYSKGLQMAKNASKLV